MAEGRFDRRVLADTHLDLVRACQRRSPCHLGGGCALSALYLSHRLSADIDLFFKDSVGLRTLAGALPEVARECGQEIRIVRDAGTFVRAVVRGPGRDMELDLVFEGSKDIEPADPVEEVITKSLVDLRASKLTCILSRSEPRDLVDLLFLDRAGYPPESDLAHALRKDAGMDPGVLAWLLGQFPTSPLPVMLEPLSEEDLARFRDDLSERLRKLAMQA